MVEYVLYQRKLAGSDDNGDFIDSIDREYGHITQRTITSNAKKMLKENNCPSGIYNMDIIKGPKSIIQSGDYYEYCIGYAYVSYIHEQEKVVIVKKSLTNIK